MKQKKISFNMLLVLLGIIPALLITCIVTVISASSITTNMKKDVFARLLVATTEMRDYYSEKIAVPCCFVFHVEARLNWTPRATS